MTVFHAPCTLHTLTDLSPEQPNEGARITLILQRKKLRNPGTSSRSHSPEVAKPGFDPGARAPDCSGRLWGSAPPPRLVKGEQAQTRFS